MTRDLKILGEKKVTYVELDIDMDDDLADLLAAEGLKRVTREELVSIGFRYILEEQMKTDKGSS